jgi:hypothetical protein
VAELEGACATRLAGVVAAPPPSQRQVLDETGGQVLQNPHLARQKPDTSRANHIHSGKHLTFCGLVTYYGFVHVWQEIGL